MSRIKIRPLADCPRRPSDKRNGYHLVSDTWGTCFFRIRKSRQDRIMIHASDDPRCWHTYTQIPLSILQDVYHLYINYRAGEDAYVHLKTGDLVIGWDEPQLSKWGKWLNRSMLVWSRSGGVPTVQIESAVYDSKDLLLIRIGDFADEIAFTGEHYMRGRSTQQVLV